MKKDIFISYKRDGGSGWAGWAELVRLGLIHYTNIKSERIFLDTHNLTQDWKIKIKLAIKNCTNFIVILSKDFEKKIYVEDDWFIEEIKEAIKSKRSIIPFLVDGVKLDTIDKKNIPDCIRQILDYQVAYYNHEFAAGSFLALKEKLCEEKDVQIKIPIVSDQHCSVRLPNNKNLKSMN